MPPGPTDGGGGADGGGGGGGDVDVDGGLEVAGGGLEPPAAGPDVGGGDDEGGVLGVDEPGDGAEGVGAGVLAPACAEDAVVALVYASARVTTATPRGLTLRNIWTAYRVPFQNVAVVVDRSNVRETMTPFLRNW